MCLHHYGFYISRHYIFIKHVNNAVRRVTNVRILATFLFSLSRTPDVPILVTEQ